MGPFSLPRGPCVADYDARMSSNRPQILYPRARLDALSDGIFAVAMTLLVLDIRLPDDFHPTGASDLLNGLLKLLPKVWPYLISFLVLGMRWLSGLQVRSRAELIGGAYIRWWLIYLLLITCVPFTTIVVGRYASFAPAIWLYAGNTALLAGVSWRLLALTPDVEYEHHRQSRQASMLVLLITALLCIGWSFVNPSQSLWAFTLNLAAPAFVRRSDAQRPVNSA